MKEILLKAKQVVQDDYHISANITVGAHDASSSGDGSSMNYGYCEDVTGQCTNEKIQRLWGSHLTLSDGSINRTTYLILNTNSQYDNKIAKISRLDNQVIVTMQYTYYEDKQEYQWVNNNNTPIFNQSDVGKTISVYIEIS